MLAGVKVISLVIAVRASQPGMANKKAPAAIGSTVRGGTDTLASVSSASISSTRGAQGRRAAVCSGLSRMSMG